VESSCVITTLPEVSPNPRSHRQSRQVIVLRLAVLFLFKGDMRVVMIWFLVLPIICLALATFMWRFERHLERLTGPWISG
jgi:hypothetical protein